MASAHPCTGNRTTGLKQPRQVAGGALCARHFYRIPGVHTFAPPFARLLPLDEFGVCSQCGQDGVISRIFEHLLHPLDRALELPPETQARGFTLHKPDPLSRSWEEVQLASE
eukprot:XP_001695266.1 predicted protein [Chlamydomonas reinhardtii]